MSTIALAAAQLAVGIIAGGGQMTCASPATGPLQCWGLNTSGQLGDGATTSSAFPKEVVGFSGGALSVAIGPQFACAVDPVGAAKCWGFNGDGLGTGTQASLEPRRVVGHESDAVAVAAGNRHACALTNFGGVRCWGYNENGQLGDGTRRATGLPSSYVAGLASGVTAIAAGDTRSCALTTGGRVYCWGNGALLGIGVNTGDRLLPVVPAGLDIGQLALAAGPRLACVITPQRGAECWGQDPLDRGQIIAPAPVPTLASGVVSIATGARHACAALDTGRVRCWGVNDRGQLGDGTLDTREAPVEVTGITDATRVAAGEQHSCAISRSQGVMCWGRNDFGQLGDGTMTPQRTSPVAVRLAAAPATSYQGLWWKSPAGSENGWGLNIAHQADTLFATWFTYGDDARPVWFVMPEMLKVSDGRYEGGYFRTTGPHFETVAWDNTRVTVTRMGDASLAFTDGSNGTFTYRVDGQLRTKAITKQVFSTSASRCVVGGTASPLNFEGLWWNTPAGSENGWGINIAHQGEVLFATWFTYRADGQPTWFVAPNTLSMQIAPPFDPAFSGVLYEATGPSYRGATWDSSLVAVVPVGTARFDMSATAGRIIYTVGTFMRERRLSRQMFALPDSGCR